MYIYTHAHIMSDKCFQAQRIIFQRWVERFTSKQPNNNATIGSRLKIMLDIFMLMHASECRVSCSECDKSGYAFFGGRPKNSPAKYG